MTGTNNTTTPAATPAAVTTPSAPAPAPAATSPAPVSETRKDTTDSWVTPDVRKAMDFDPFTPTGDETQVPTTPTTTDGTPSADGGTSAQPASVPVPPVTGGTPQSDDFLAIARENSRLLNAVLSSPVPAATPAPGQPATKVQTPDEILSGVPDYMYNLPDQLLAGMRSEDPNENRQATQAMISGVAKGIHQTIAHAAQKKIAALEASIPALIQQTVQGMQLAQRVETDFYGKYPQFNTPEIRQIVAKVWANHYKQTGDQGWSDQTRDAIGQKVLTIIQSAMGTVQTQPAVAPAPAPIPPAMFGGGGNGAGNPRQPAPAGVHKTQQDHMIDIL